MGSWICGNPKCGHNRSQHTLHWSRLRGKWETYCQYHPYGLSVSEQCNCPAFVDQEEQAG